MHFLKVKLFEINIKINLKVIQGPVAIVQQLNARPTLTEDRSSVLRPTSGSSQSVVTPAPGDPTSSSAPIFTNVPILKNSNKYVL